MTSFIVNSLKKNIPLNFRRKLINGMRKPLRTWIFDNFGLNIVSKEKLFNDSEKYHVFQFGSEELIRVSEPCKSSIVPQIITDGIRTLTLQQPFVVEVENAELVGPAAIGFDEDGSLIPETVIPTRLKGISESLKTSVPEQTLILKKLPSFGAPQLDTACSLVSSWPENYYNWIIYCLTRLEGLEYYQEKTGKKPFLIIDSNPPKWKIESLRLLGYKPEDCIQWNRSKIKVKQLVVPSFRVRLKIPQRSGCHWLRQRILSNLPELESKQFSPRVYISRPKKVGRNIINEDDVIEALSLFGFVAYTPENLSFSEQVRLFSQAEIVIAPHGAGLTNIVFGNNLNVIEIFSSYGTPAYFLLANVLGFRYGCLASDPKPEDGKQYDQFKGILVDITKLRTLVEQMLEIPASQAQAEFSH